jgi:hypothetical protein
MIAHCWLAAEFAVSEPRCCSCCLIRSSCLVTEGHLGEADATDHSAVAAACFTTVGFLDIDCGACTQQQMLLVIFIWGWWVVAAAAVAAAIVAEVVVLTTQT